MVAGTEAAAPRRIPAVRAYPRIERLTPEAFMGHFRTFLLKHASTGAIAHFSMEVYGNDGRAGGGGLGTLSWDWLHECADKGLAVIGVTIGHKKLQHQRFDGFWQTEVFDNVDFEHNPTIAKLRENVTVEIQGRPIAVDIYGKLIEGRNGDVVPLLMLTTASETDLGFGRIPERVYPGKHDPFATLGQEMILGLGGVKALKKLGVPVKNFI